MVTDRVSRTATSMPLVAAAAVVADWKVAESSADRVRHKTPSAPSAAACS